MVNALNDEVPIYKWALLYSSDALMEVWNESDEQVNFYGNQI